MIYQNGLRYFQGNSHLSIEHNGNEHSGNGTTSNGHAGSNQTGNGHAGSSQTGSEVSLEALISKGTECVNALTEALKRDEQRFSLPRDDKRSNLAKNDNIAGAYFKSKFGNQNGDLVQRGRIILLIFDNLK